MRESNFDKREALEKIGYREFADYGYDGASINKILEEANVPKGVFYYHFESKEDFYMYLIERLIQKKKEALTTQANEKPKHFHEYFKTIAKQAISKAKEELDQYRFVQKFLNDIDSQINKKALLRHNFTGNHHFKSIIAYYIATGDIRNDLPEPLITNYITLILNNITTVIKENDVEHFNAKLDDLWDMLYYGIKGDNRNA